MRYVVERMARSVRKLGAQEREDREHGIGLAGTAHPDEVRLVVEGTPVVLAFSPDDADKAAAMLHRLAAGARRLAAEASQPS